MIINNTVDEDKYYNNANVYSGHLKWVPIGNQKQKFTGANELKPLFDDILVAKLRPG
jgi:DNA-directed RNA polymerases I and III subunit RPAC1